MSVTSSPSSNMNGQVISVLVGGVAGVWHDVIEHEGLRWEFIKKKKKVLRKKECTETR